MNSLAKAAILAVALAVAGSAHAATGTAHHVKHKHVKHHVRHAGVKKHVKVAHVKHKHVKVAHLNKHVKKAS